VAQFWRVPQMAEGGCKSLQIRDGRVDRDPSGVWNEAHND